jgi:hypothetical protein
MSNQSRSLWKSAGWATNLSRRPLEAIVRASPQYGAMPDDLEDEVQLAGIREVWWLAALSTVPKAWLSFGDDPQ